MTTKEKLPNATTVLILGIISLFMVPFGWIPAGIGIYLSRKGILMNKENPEAYSNFRMLNIGYILSIIGTIISAIAFIWYMMYTAGRAILHQP